MEATIFTVLGKGGAVRRSRSSRRVLLAPLVMVIAAWSSSAAAEEEGPAPAPAPVPWTPPPAPAEKSPATGAAVAPAAPSCADPEAEGPLLSSTGCSGVLGLRGSVSEVRGAAADEGTGLMLASEGEEFVRRRIFTARDAHRFAIGGGGAGFEGTLQIGLSGGFRIPLGERHGPVFRAGAFGYVRGNDAFYASLLDLPQVQIGYQYQRGTTVVELGATGGAVLTGRFRAGESETRVLGAGFEAGIYAAVQVPWFRLGFHAMRLPATDALATPVRTGEGTLCAIAPPVAICADARVTLADARILPNVVVRDVSTVYAGLTFGLAR